MIENSRQKFHHRAHIQRGQPKGSLRNITFPNITILYYSSFTYQVSRFTTRQLNFINLPLRNMEVTPFDNNVMATIIKLRNQHKRADLASIYKELTKNLELNKFTEDHLKNRINALLVNGKIINKPNRDRPSYLLNENVSPTVDHVYEPELLETQLTPLNSPLSAPRLDGEIETPTIGQQHTSPSILENELFLDTMLKKAHYTTFKNEIITELQKTVEGIFRSELEQFKIK